MKAKRMAAILLAAALTIPCWNLAAKAAFSDVPSNAWYAQDVAAAEKYGILQGTGNGRFSPDGNLTLAQAITMAARTYAYERGETIPKTGGSTWYSDFLQYANDKGICAIGEFGAAYDNFCNRLTMAKLFARVVPESTATQRNDVTTLPDVQSASENQAVFTLYQLGILTGSDKYGTFHPYQYIKRSETAAILNRVLNPDMRKSFTLEKAPTLEQIYANALVQAWDYFEDDIKFAQDIGIDMGDFGYVVYDIDNNGVPELLVGFTGEDEAEFVYAAYTIQNYHAVCLFTGSIPQGNVYQDNYVLYPNGVIENFWYAGNQGHASAYYKLNSNGSLKLLEAWEFQYDPNPNKQYRYSSTSTDPWGNPKAFKYVKESYINNLAKKYGVRKIHKPSPCFRTLAEQGEGFRDFSGF